MSLHPRPLEPVPEETARVARAAFPKGNLYLTIRDELGTIYSDEQFTDLYPNVGQPALAAWRLALVTVFQFLEGLSDRQAAEAVRSRIDWKYALGLELTDPGFDASVLCEFRARLVAHEASERLLTALLEQCQARGWLTAGGKQRTDSTHVLAAIRTLNRLELVGETLRAALESIAVVAPQWLQSWVPDDWFARYSRRIEEGRLPSKEADRHAYAEQIGADGARLLSRVYEPQAPAFLRALPAVQEVRLTWIHQFLQEEGRVRLRSKEDLPPCTLRHDSPYDPQAHYSTKRSMSWIGYKVHLTETCDQEQPHLIIDVQTTPAPTTDGEQTERIHAALADKQLLPAEHLVDSGYVEAEGVVSSQQTYGIHLLGPVRPDPSWQAQAEAGYAAADFQIDWQGQQARCPQGHHSVLWQERADHLGHATVTIGFAKSTCAACAMRARCTHSTGQPRQLTIRAHAAYDALQARRQEQGTPGFQQAYALRAGVEGTISQAVRAFGVRQTRYLGLAKTHLQQVGSAVALDLCRLHDWLLGKPRARTRTSHFAALAPAA
jgi:transposase